MEKIFLLAVFYGSFLVFPIIGLVVWFFYKKRSWVYLLVLFLAFVFIWARFIEPQLILIKKTQIKVGFDTKIALVADIHLGVYKDENFLERVVNKINQQEIEMVLIAGDFTFEPNKTDLKKLFAPLKRLKFPVFAVLGNHDVGFPGPPIRHELVKVLKYNDVMVLENQMVQLNKIKLIGLGSHFAREDNVNMLYDYTESENIVVLAHNPDTTSRYYKNNVDLTLVGHTHGGQIRIPWLYKKVIPTKGEFDKGFSQEKRTKLFISSGLGEVGLPMRLLNPPTIEILTLE